MKKILTLSLASFIALASTVVLANQYDGLTCAGKKATIEQQLDMANKANNTHQAKGLEKALNNVNDYCSNADLQKKYEEKVQQKRNKVADRKAELDKAQQKGNAEKIARQETKLKEAKTELTIAQDHLDHFHKALKAE